MKIAIYHNHLAGGAAKVTEEWLKRYAKNHHVEIFTPASSTTGHVDLDGLVKATHRFPVAGSGSLAGRYRQTLDVPRYGQEIAAAIDAGGFDMVFANLSYVTQAPEVLPYLRTPSLYYAPESLRAVYEKFPFGNRQDARSLVKRLAVLAIGRQLKRLDRRNIRAASRVFTHSHYTAGTLRDIYGIEAEVVHLGVDTDTFRPSREKRQNFVLSVGAMHPAKGHHFVIEALATLPPEQRPKLLVVGPRGEDFAVVLRRYAADHGVEFESRHGIPLAELVSLYNRCALMTAGQYREPFGLMTLEAMATETAVVAVDEGGLQETVTDRKTGLLIARDPAKFGAAVGQVLADPQLAAKLGKTGRADCLKRWRWDETARRIETLLAETAQTADTL